MHRDIREGASVDIDSRGLIISYSEELSGDAYSPSYPEDVFSSTCLPHRYPAPSRTGAI